MKKILFVQTNYPNFLTEFHNKIGEKILTYENMKRRWDKKWFGQANFYSGHLRPLGWQAKEVIVNDWIMQSRWAREHKLNITRENRGPLEGLPESIKNYLGLRSWVKRILFEQVKSFKPDVIYVHDLSLLNEADLGKLRQDGQLVVGQIACPLPINLGPLRKYDLIVSSFPHFVRLFRKMGIKSEYLRWCFEPEIARTIGRLPKKYGVVFVGGYSRYHSQGNKMLEVLAKNVKVDFWGYDEQTQSPTSAIRQYFHGRAWGRKMYEIFAQAKIVVNRHIDVAGSYANNMRMFDVTGMGSLLVTDDKKNMAEFFEVDREVITYKNTADLVKKVKYYLKHGLIRERIAKAGQKRTLKEHTYAVRMRELDKILRSYLV